MTFSRFTLLTTARVVVALGVLALSAAGAGALGSGTGDDCCAAPAAPPSGAVDHDDHGDCDRSPGCPDRCGHCSLPCCSGLAAPHLVPSAIPAPDPESRGSLLIPAALRPASRLDARDLERPPRR